MAYLFTSDDSSLRCLYIFFNIAAAVSQFSGEGCDSKVRILVINESIIEELRVKSFFELCLMVHTKYSVSPRWHILFSALSALGEEMLLIIASNKEEASSSCT